VKKNSKKMKKVGGRGVYIPDKSTYISTIKRRYIMKIIVKHMERNEITGDVEGFTPVALVDVTDLSNHAVEEQLEYAFRYTNNVMGSWSKKIGEDANDDVEVLVEREDGLGLRSTSMGDRMEIDGTEYRVAMVGFKEVA
jgi:hypothetical protein